MEGLLPPLIFGSGTEQKQPPKEQKAVNCIELCHTLGQTQGQDTFKAPPLLIKKFKTCSANTLETELIKQRLPDAGQMFVHTLSTTVDSLSTALNSLAYLNPGFKKIEM